MATAIITGAGGLIGSEACRFFHDKGFDIIGIDNDMRKYFFGPTASTSWNVENLQKTLIRFTLYPLDIRNRNAMLNEFSALKLIGKDVQVIIHTAAQPSHDWAAKEPFTDFDINAVATLNLLEATRINFPKARFIFTSTNKVYGDTPNTLDFKETPLRWEIEEKYTKWNGIAGWSGISEKMSIDTTKHSIFGASKVAADIMVQEYGRYFNMPTVCFRGGCLTGPSHSGANLHGFLSYLVKCVVTGKKYEIYGYKGKQVRDNIHSWDVVNAFWYYFKDTNPELGAVYNIGGGRANSCSVLEALGMAEKLSKRAAICEIKPESRVGDHKWWITSMGKFLDKYSSDGDGWSWKYNLETIMKQMVDAELERLST